MSLPPVIPFTPTTTLPTEFTTPVPTLGTQYDELEYTYNFYQYPIDVDLNERHGYNFCVFYINVPGLSSTATKNSKILAPSGTPTRAQQGTNGITIQGTNALGGVGTTSRRTKTAIKTYMPNVIELNHNMKYENAELGGLAGIASIDENVTMEDLIKSAGVEGVRLISALSGKIGKVIGESIGGPKGAAVSGISQFLDKNRKLGEQTIQALSGISINPHVETLFKGVEFRRFNFIFDFFPKNEEEQIQVRDIINLFRFHMHPELFDPNGANRAFIRPSEFDIVFYHGDVIDEKNKRVAGVIENTYLFAISSCVLVDIKVDYTATGMWSAHYQGAPVGMRITLTFQELEIMTKNRLAELEFNRFNTIQSTTIGF